MGTSPFKIALDDQGREVPDDTPIVLMIGDRPVTDFDRIRDFIKVQMSNMAAENGVETLDEANDFAVDDDLFPMSPHEYDESTEEADRATLDAERARRDAARSAPDGALSDGLAPSRPGVSAAVPAVESTSGPAVQAGPAT